MITLFAARRAIVRPIRQLDDAARRIRDGDSSPERRMGANDLQGVLLGRPAAPDAMREPAQLASN